LDKLLDKIPDFFPYAFGPALMARSSISAVRLAAARPVIFHKKEPYNMWLFCEK